MLTVMATATGAWFMSMGERRAAGGDLEQGLGTGRGTPTLEGCIARARIVQGGLAHPTLASPQAGRRYSTCVMCGFAHPPPSTQLAADVSLQKQSEAQHSTADQSRPSRATLDQSDGERFHVIIWPALALVVSLSKGSPYVPFVGARWLTDRPNARSTCRAAAQGILSGVQFRWSSRSILAWEMIWCRLSMHIAI